MGVVVFGEAASGVLGEVWEGEGEEVIVVRVLGASNVVIYSVFFRFLSLLIVLIL